MSHRAHLQDAHTAPVPVQSAILTIGDELLAGRTQDTNSHYLCRRLVRLGVPPKEIRVVADDDTAIQLAIWDLTERRGADLVITSGGLGPTHDDRTVHAISTLHGAPLEHHAPTMHRMTKRAQDLHAQGKRDTPEPGAGANKVALVPKNAVVLPNPAGAAPGLLLQRPLHYRHGTAWTLVLPGVPQELRAIWTRHAESWIRDNFHEAEKTRRTTKRFECHAQESDLAPHLLAVEQQHPDVHVGSYPGWGTTRIVLSLTGPPERLEAAATDLTKRLDALGVELALLADDEEG